MSWKTAKAPSEVKTDRMDTLADFAWAPKTLARGLGYKADVPDSRDFKARALFGARRTLPLEATELEGCVPVVSDQGSTLSCVGQAIGGAIDARLRKMGRWDAPLVSRQAVYTFARVLARMKPADGLFDQGSFPRQAMKSLKAWGVPTAQRWPFNPATINDELPWDVMQAASAFTLAAWWRIDSLGQERIEDICQAIANGFPVVFGLSVDRAFLEHVGKGTVGRPDPTQNVGGHMMYAVGYKTVNGERLVRCVNSWGTGWGDAGFFWASEAFFRTATDLHVIQVG